MVGNKGEGLLHACISSLNMKHDEVYGKFVLTVCICSILYFCKKFADCKKTDSASLSQEV